MSGYNEPKNGDLTPWASKGVLLLNKSLTTIEGKRNAHKGMWDRFIQNVIESLNKRYDTPVLYWLMGNEARGLKPFIRNAMLYETVHPSPLTGKKFLAPHFKNINDLLKKEDLNAIDWSL